MKSNLANKFQDARWKNREDRFLESAGRWCRSCGGEEQAAKWVHVSFYPKDLEPWDFPDECLVPLCDACLQERRDREGDIKSLWGGFSNSDLSVIADVLETASRATYPMRARVLNRIRDAANNALNMESRRERQLNGDEE